MKRHIVFLTFLLIFLVATLSLATAIVTEAPKVAVNETIYIKADGLIYPPIPSIIAFSNATYAFVDDINGSIVVEKSSIVIDGLNHSLAGLNTGDGLYLRNISDVTIRNLRVELFRNGMVIEQSSNITINGCEITRCKYGLSLISTICSTISNNNMSGNTYHGIVLSSSSNSSLISENILMLNGEDGVTVLSSQYNHLVGNNITKNGNGIRLGNSSCNTIIDNTIVDSLATGFASSFSKNNTLSRNKVAKNTAGIVLESSSDHEISENSIRGNYLNGALLDFSYNNTIFNNTVMNNMGQAGIFLDSSNENNISNNCLISNRKGVSIKDAANNLVVRNNITKNSCGVCTEDYTGVRSNGILENDIMNNSCGVRLGYGAENNRIICNNFMNNGEQISLATNALTNCWNSEYPEGGNYWSDYNGIDCLSSPFQNETGSDGIGDAPYTMDANNTDRYPLKGMFSHFNVGLEYSVHIICNSSISDFQFDGNTFRFGVTGYDETAGFCRICIPATLLDIPYKVFVNGTEVSYNLLLLSNETHNYLYFSFTHSMQEVVIIPEFHAFFILPPFVIVTLLAVNVFKRKRSA